MSQFKIVFIFSFTILLSASLGCSTASRRSAADPRGWYQIETIFVSNEGLENPQRGIVFVRSVPTLDPHWYSPVCFDEGTPKYDKPFYITALDTANDESARIARNNLQSAMFGVSDQAFDDHMASTFAAQDVSNLALGWTALGLSAAASVSGGSAQLLSAISTAVQGAKSQFNEEVYAKQLSQSISNIIKEDRNLFRQQLMTNFPKSVADYPVEAAIADAKEFHRRGSFFHGLELLVQAAQEKASQNKKAADNFRNPKKDKSGSTEDKTPAKNAKQKSPVE